MFSMFQVGFGDLHWLHATTKPWFQQISHFKTRLPNPDRMSKCLKKYVVHVQQVVVYAKLKRTFIPINIYFQGT